jgi:hypothetical protein
MKVRIILFFPCFCLLVLSFPADTPALGLAVKSGLDYQNRNFKAGGMEYDLNYWGLFIKPTVRISTRWSVFARLAYSRLVFDRPHFSATDYDHWGFEWGGGSDFTLFRWSGLYAVLEGEFSRTDTSYHPREGGKEEGSLILWQAGARAGWDFKVVNPYIGCDYTAGRIRHRYSSSGLSFTEYYHLEDRWKIFAGGRINIPPFTNLEGRYYFGRDVLVVLSMGIEF